MYVSNAGAPAETRVRQLPYFNFSEIATVASSRDMLPGDGWLLVSRDFGGNVNNPVIGDPWFLVYNQRRGLLRLCLLNAFGYAYSYQRVLLKLQNAAHSGGIFALTSSDNNTALRLTAPTNQARESFSEVEQQGSWTIHDFYLGYDPNINPNTIFEFNIKNFTQTVTTGTITGSLNGKAIVTQTSQTKSHEIFKNSGEFAKAVDKKFPNINITDFIQSFDLLTAAVGIAKFFIGGKKTEQTIPINLDVNAAVDLNSITEVAAKTIRVNAFASSWANDGFAYKPLNPITWGLINIKQTPNVYIDTETTCEPNGPYAGECECFTNYSYRTVRDEIRALIELNPTSGMRIVDVKVGITRTGYSNPLLIGFVNDGSEITGGTLNNHIGELVLKITLESIGTAVNMDRQYTVIRAVPLKFVYGNYIQNYYC